MQDRKTISFESDKNKQLRTVVHGARKVNDGHRALHTHIDTLLIRVQVSGQDQCGHQLIPVTKEDHPEDGQQQDILAEFDYVLEYKLGRENVVAYKLRKIAYLAAITTTHCDIHYEIKNVMQHDPEAKKLIELAAQGKIMSFWMQKASSLMQVKGSKYPILDQ